MVFDKKWGGTLLCFLKKSLDKTKNMRIIKIGATDDGCFLTIG